MKTRTHCEFTGGQSDYCWLCGENKREWRHFRREFYSNLSYVLVLIIPLLGLMASIGGISEPTLILIAMTVAAMSAGLVAWECIR